MWQNEIMPTPNQTLLVFCGLLVWNVMGAEAPNRADTKYQEKIFNHQRFSKVECAPNQKNGKLQSLSVEQEGLPTQTLGWDENGQRL